jgi:hypothetical protein
MIVWVVTQCFCSGNNCDRYYHYKNIMLQLTLSYTVTVITTTKKIVLQLKLSYTFTDITTTKTLCYNSNYHIPSQILPLQKHFVTTHYHIPSQLLPLQKHFVTTQTIIYLHNYYHYKNILLQLKLSYTFTVIITTKTLCYNSNYHIPSHLLPPQCFCSGNNCEGIW